jgi:LPS-assembly lipoprotein
MPAFLLSRLPALLLMLAIGSLVSGCFRPMYSTDAISSGSNVAEKMRAVEVAAVKTSGQDRRLPRLGGQIRNELIFQLTGGGEPNTADYRVVVSISGGLSPVIAKVSTGRSSIQSYLAAASYSLIDISTGKVLISDSTFSRSSFELPGQQYFAAQRAQRDAEDRAAKLLAENIRNRLASYFYTGVP